ncbi:MAG: hypothetical protein ABFC96_01440 [Thermoguttaceae bacterium]
MRKFATKLDEDFARREFPIVGLVDGWFFRCREVAVGGVYRVEGTDLWGTKVSAEGTDREGLLRDCAESARQMKGHVKEVLFGDSGSFLRLDGDKLILNVLCGRAGQWGVEFALNDSEREQYKRQGDSFIKELAEAVYRNPSAYKSRAKGAARHGILRRLLAGAREWRGERGIAGS